ncbi:ErfK/YbiS/YcfS/YnhG family protein [Beggiatoa sp. PS]|nr:ErfK/YbiS/YcfS/YnhG family protein [Beggiatoa sp. PS]
MMPVMVLSLAHCKDDSVQLSSQSPVNNTKPSAEVVTTKPISENSQSLPETPQCVMPPLKSRIEVSISEQQLYLYCRYSDHEEIKTYPVSTSKYGIGSEAGSNKTPLGAHRIKDKIGDGAQKGMIFKARRSTGQIAEMNVEGAGDLVTTRIMWLTGLEQGANSGPGIDSYQRYIYIHGTGEENKIGQPASHGCIRMYNDDVINLFDLVTEGTEVHIRE